MMRKTGNVDGNRSPEARAQDQSPQAGEEGIKKTVDASGHVRSPGTGLHSSLRTSSRLTTLAIVRWCFWHWGLFHVLRRFFHFQHFILSIPFMRRLSTSGKALVSRSAPSRVFEAMSSPKHHVAWTWDLPTSHSGLNISVRQREFSKTRNRNHCPGLSNRYQRHRPLV